MKSPKPPNAPIQVPAEEELRIVKHRSTPHLIEEFHLLPEVRAKGYSMLYFFRLEGFKVWRQWRCLRCHFTRRSVQSGVSSLTTGLVGASNFSVFPVALVEVEDSAASPPAGFLGLLASSGSKTVSKIRSPSLQGPSA